MHVHCEAMASPKKIVSQLLLTVSPSNPTRTAGRRPPPTTAAIEQRQPLPRSETIPSQLLFQFLHKYLCPSLLSSSVQVIILIFYTTSVHSCDLANYLLIASSSWFVKGRYSTQTPPCEVQADQSRLHRLHRLHMGVLRNCS